MIKNERQLTAAERSVDQLSAAIPQAATEAERISLTDTVGSLQNQISEYLTIAAGELRSFSLESIDDLPDALIKARLARQLTQRQLSERLGVSEQMVQRDESGSYDRASMARVASALDALGYELRGVLEQIPEGTLTFTVPELIVQPSDYPRYLDALEWSEVEEVAR